MSRPRKNLSTTMAGKRSDAITLEESRYFTGRPCCRGHVAPRSTASGACLECQREYDRLRYSKNPEPFREAARAHKKRNAAYYSALASKRKAARKRSQPAWADDGAILSAYREADQLTQLLGIPHHVDHIIPLHADDVSGLHVENNLQVITAVQNMRKGTRWR